MAKKIADHLTEMSEAGHLKKPSLQISTYVESEGLMDGPDEDLEMKFAKQDKARLTKEIQFLRDQLRKFDPEAAARKVKRSLQKDLRLKRARLAECNARIDAYKAYR